MLKMERILYRENLLTAPQLSGIIVPLMTPFKRTDDGQGKTVDTASQDLLIKRLITVGVHGIFLGSNAGEGRQMDVANWKLSINSGIESVRSTDAHIPVVVGVLRKDLKEVVSLALYAQKQGADALVLAPGFTEADIYDTRNKVMQATNIPIVLYNNPEFHGDRSDLDDGKNLPITFIGNSAKSERIIGVKDTSRSLTYLAQLLKYRDPNSFHVFQGNTEGNGYINEISADCDGMVPVEANVYPEALVKLWENGDSNDLYKVLEYFKQHTEESGGTLRLIKKLLNDPNDRVLATAMMYEDE